MREMELSRTHPVALKTQFVNSFRGTWFLVGGLVEGSSGLTVFRVTKAKTVTDKTAAWTKASPSDRSGLWKTAGTWSSACRTQERLKLLSSCRFSGESCLAPSLQHRDDQQGAAQPSMKPSVVWHSWFYISVLTVNVREQVSRFTLNLSLILNIHCINNTSVSCLSGRDSRGLQFWRCFQTLRGERTTSCCPRWSRRSPSRETAEGWRTLQQISSRDVHHQPPWRSDVAKTSHSRYRGVWGKRCNGLI